MIGEVQSGYEYLSENDQVDVFAHTRPVSWLASVSRDHLSQSGRNTLGSVSTVFTLSPEVVEELMAALKGGDSTTAPSDKVEVQHRSGAIGSNSVRSFIGALRDGDNGLFVSTGGFTREARYEAERATILMALIEIDDMADLIVAHYAKFDLVGQTLLPLVRVCWPAE